MSKEDRDKIGNPDSLGQTILDEVVKQFSNQVGLDLTSETLTQEYDKAHPNEAGGYNKQIGDDVMKRSEYKSANKDMKQKQQAGTLRDEYTGKKLQLGKDKANLDHVVPRKEIFENRRRKQAGLETADLANKSENLAATNESLNKSKGAKSNSEQIKYLKDNEQSIRANAEKRKEKIDADKKMSDMDKRHAKDLIDKRTKDKLAANEDLMNNVSKKAQTAINQDIRNGTIKNTANKAKENALKAMATASLLDLLKEVIQGLVRFFKSKAKSFKKFLDEMKESIKSFMSKITNYIRVGTSNVIGTVTTEIIEYVFAPIVSMFEHFTSMLKQGISSFMEAINFLTDKENKDKPFDEKIAQVGKIVTVGLVGAGGILLGEAIEKALIQPSNPLAAVFNTKIHLLGTIGNITALFLASLIAGVLGAIVMNWIDKQIANRQIAEASKKIDDKQNELLQHQQVESVVFDAHLDHSKAKFEDGSNERRKFADEESMKILENIESNSKNSKNKADNQVISEHKGKMDKMSAELKNLGF
ncbi:MAG: hypothetical protein FWE43_00630 [Streptococcaceae bacterium]|nr:hypothetical protein [Streptococcaceae bacterium]